MEDILPIPLRCLTAVLADLAANAPPADILTRLAALEPNLADPAARARLLHARGLALNRLGLSGEALGALHAARDLLAPGDPEAAALWRAIAQVHAWRGDGREAALALLPALAASRDDPDAFALALVEAGRLDLEIGRPREARDLFARGLAGPGLPPPERMRARIALAQACLAGGDDAAAAQALDGLDAAAAPVRIRHLARIERARLALRADEFERAEALLAQVAVALPAEPDAFEHVEHAEVAAELALRRGQAGAALGLIRSAVARFAEDDLAGREVGARLTEADCLDALGQPEAAERTLFAALRRALARSLAGQADRVRARLAERGAPVPAWSPGAAPAVPASDPGTRFVRRRPLGEGGFGTVSRAYDLETGREVALKRLRLGTLYDHQARRDLIEGAAREVTAASRLRHPGIGRVFGLLDEADGDTLLVRDLVEGPTLREAMGAGLGTAERLALLAELAHALAAIHAGGVVHHDLKPENVVLRAGLHPVVIDFGISSVGPGRSGCTPAYAAPEQLAGEAAGPAADCFALGVIAFELVVGRLPERLPAGWLTWPARRRAAAALRARCRDAGLPEEATEIVAGCLAPGARGRPDASAAAAAFQIP